MDEVAIVIDEAHGILAIGGLVVHPSILMDRRSTIFYY